MIDVEALRRMNDDDMPYRFMQTLYPMRARRYPGARRIPLKVRRFVDYVRDAFGD
ncbi:hypothetical protein [Burkholderia sp. 8Y]|uniref:hypothetical protein n=1 Tax=Burkholderia sp. 8Y TaxID=2653133 RepID=UPI001356E52E|nr:hypothetical protein [Burkholderia sp. 8Y]